MSVDPITSLIDVDHSVLIIIDVQDYFLNKLEATQRASLLARLSWLIYSSQLLGVPILATAEDIPNCGTISAQVKELLPPATPIYNKMWFGLSSEPAIMKGPTSIGRSYPIICGLETDVCVAQSAIGLAQLPNMWPVVVRDAVASPQPNHDLGLMRLQEASIPLITTKALYYEWVRFVEKDNQIKASFREKFGMLPIPL